MVFCLVRGERVQETKHGLSENQYTFKELYTSLVKHSPVGCTSTCRETRNSPASVLLRSAFGFGLACSVLAHSFDCHVCSVCWYNIDVFSGNSQSRSQSRSQASTPGEESLTCSAGGCSIVRECISQVRYTKPLHKSLCFKQVIPYQPANQQRSEE